ncbi:N-glycosylation protein-domain-containing protein [Fusarium tricinctum]|uniref:N-glycosylation protein-domain-containing protein n=1 Tax=Fusarium tricinctum TaxID=61284 RepID=A0A8K0RNX1_9HYPO|nr:N-glycosylation protein-domain-containing protein [Fusarium tricinctum]
MGNPPPVRRGSSTGHLPQPLAPVTPKSNKYPPPPPPPPTTTTAPPELDGPVHPSLLQPRVAVVLNVPTPWHPWLFVLRLISILPALWWGLPSALQLLMRVVPGPEVVFVVPSTTGGSVAMSYEADTRYTLTETGLGTIWCFASGYLSFFFTDCLMSRWLINYTPQATMVRLLTTNICNAYLTSTFLSLAGGFEDPRLLLPGWIGIATTLTVLYHITHQKINIRKETSTSINVFSIASFFSMVTLLAHMHQFTPEYPQMPIAAKAQHVWDEVSRVVAQARAQARGSIEQHDGL